MARAGKRQVVRAVSRANQLAETATRESAVLLRTIDTLTQHIAKLMQEAHGGDWRVQIEHDAGLLVVARRLDDRVPPINLSSLRGAV